MKTGNGKGFANEMFKMNTGKTIKQQKNELLKANLRNAIKTNEQPSHKVTEAEAFGNDCPNNSCS